MTSTDGRCVARIRWMPTARAICASRQIDSSTSLPATIIRSASSSITTMMNGSVFAGSPFLAGSFWSIRIRMLRLYLLDVPHPFRRQGLVPLLHLADGPPQRVRGLLRVDDDRREQVRDVLVHPELEPLRVDHDQPHVVRRRAVEDAREHPVQADRLARAGRSGDEQVRHGGQVRDERLAVNRLAERERQLGGRAHVRLRLEQLAERDRLAVHVGDLDADGGLAGQPIDEHGFGLHRQAEVVGEPGDLAVLHAGVGLELVGRHHRARMDLHDGAFDRELAALLLEVPRAFHQLALVDLALGAGRIEQRQRRQGEAAELPFDRRARRADLRLRQRLRRRRDDAGPLPLARRSGVTLAGSGAGRARPARVPPCS